MHKIPGAGTTFFPGCAVGIPRTQRQTFLQLVPEIPGTQVPICLAASDPSAGHSVSRTVYQERLDATSTLQMEVEKVSQELCGVSKPASERGQYCTTVPGKPNAHQLTFWLDLEYVLAFLPHKHP